ncbi:MAG: heparin lyase I family protein [Planctomycetes bacterium]|nr:heparin lyase I family protein [Planctomycetota bacterium]
MFLKYPSAFLPCLLCASLLAGPQAPAPDVSPKKPPPKLFDGFETGRLADFWRPGDYGSGRYEAGAVTIQDRVVRSGKYAACITVREGDIEQQGKRRKSERAELDSGKLSVIGQEVWYGFSFLLPNMAALLSPCPPSSLASASV